MVTSRVVSLKQLPKNQWLKKLTLQISEWPSPHALKEAELLWIRQGQAEINFNDHNIMKLDPVFDEKEGVYRVGGRIKNAPQSRHKGKPKKQKMADLPDFRVKPCSPPFSSTLVDYLGPVNVKLNKNTTTKGYCAVFTCAVTRAVSKILLPKRSYKHGTICIRGAPSLLVSDNGTCFRGADNTINELNLRLDETKIREQCQRYNVQWKFGPPGGPHHLGAVERMVQEVKKGMRQLVKADRLTFVEWETVFCQISGLINSRPLTAKSSSPLDHPPFTPNHFLIGRGDLQCPELVPYEEFHGNLRKRREICNSMMNGFWHRWMECIHKLSPRLKWQK
ncbi:uncharacterized protein [Antedon mediterranea]|uniref:uncharacterized protein n=1 Tax=Antedon mediterranea TaxID=105859 RepID=UPI003AF61431